MAKSLIGYTLYAILLAGVLLYYRFPAEAVERYLAGEFARAVPGAELIVGETRPALPPGLILEPAGVARAGTILLRLDRVRLRPALFSLLGDRPETDVEIRAFGGRLDGSVTLSRSPGRGTPETASVRIADIDLSGIEAFRDLSPHAVTGRLDGEIDYDGGDGAAILTVTDGGLEFAAPLFNLDRLSFARIEARLRLDGNRTLRLEECALTGNQVGGNLSGTLTLATPAEDSLLDLRGEIRPHPALFAALDEGAAMLFRRNRGGQPIPFSIRGSLASPRFSLE
jgi:type II secretion system protein N